MWKDSNIRVHQSDSLHLGACVLQKKLMEQLREVLNGTATSLLQDRIQFITRPEVLNNIQISKVWEAKG